MLNFQVVRDRVIAKDKWVEGHGAQEATGYLGTGILYFALAYLLPAQTAVVLGSGSGFVPRLIREAQRQVPELKSRTILIDAGEGDPSFGISDYHEDETHFFKVNYPDVEIWKMTTNEGAAKLESEGIKIDLIHIDADHTYEQSRLDFENYLPLMSSDFCMTLHDSGNLHLEGLYDGCVPRLIAELRREMEKGGKYDSLEMVNFNNRMLNPHHPFKEKMNCRGTALIKPKKLGFWDKWISGVI
jgi:hypothetical protein